MRSDHKVMCAAARNFQLSCYVMTAALAPAVMAVTMTAENYASSLRRMTIMATGETRHAASTILLRGGGGGGWRRRGR